MSEQYIVSARKYRPDTFASIVGQGAMSTTLRTAVLSGRMAHAYLFCGPRGVGKTTAARVLAKTINCLNLSPEGEACNACESCQAFNEGRSFNIFELDAASNNSVEDIRSLTEQVLIAPVLGRYKVYIIDEVHMLSQAAFNAFLKTLEEPPSYAIFILATTEKHKILPTILSRCQTYDFKRITVMDIAGHLRYVAQSEGIEADEQALGLIAEKADGGMRDALSMFDRVASYGQGKISYQNALDCLNILDYSYYTRFIEGFVSGDYRGLLLTLDEVLRRGFDGQLVMSGLATFARDLLVVQHTDTISLLEKPQQVQELYAQTARIVAPSALHQIIRLLVSADGQYRSSSNKRLLIELTFLNILSAFQPNALETAAQMPTAQLAPRSVQTEAVAPQVAEKKNSSSSHTPSSTNASVGAVSIPAPSPAPASKASVGRGQQPSSVATQAVSNTGVGEGVQVAKATDATTTVHSALQSSTASPTPTAQINTPPSISPPIPSNRMDGMQTRQRFRSRQRNQAKDEENYSLGEELHNAYAEEDVQQAWMRYVEQEISDEQVLLKNLLSNVIPRMGEGHSVLVPLLNTQAVLDPMQQLLPKIQLYIQRAVQNTDLHLDIELVAPQDSYQPTTNSEKYEALQHQYPFLQTFRQQLELRVM